MEIDVDFAQSAGWNHEMPERMRWMRENEPVFWSEKTNSFIISRFHDVVYVSKHSELFCSGQGVLPDPTITNIGMIDEDEPRHGEMRGLINRGFTPRMVKKWQEIFQTITNETLDEIAPKGECDFVEDIAVPLPLILIAEMIGIRREDRDRFHQWSDAMIGSTGNMDDPLKVAAAGKAALEYVGYLTEIIEDRRANPREDLISILVRANDDGTLIKHKSYGSADDELREQNYGNDPNVDTAQLRDMNNDELIKMCVLLLVAGNETTRNGLTGAMQLLIENPDVRARLIENPDLIPGAVEEMLRLVSPVVSFSRTVTADTELRGVPIKQGQKVLMIYGSANRDAEVFENPDELDIDRNSQHVAFGIGNHFCMGANLARMELRVALVELLKRIPDMSYATVGPEFGSSALVRSVQHMHVKFTPESK
jgi:cytochrome P450 family 142 subfamily A polypeptide 1